MLEEVLLGNTGDLDWEFCGPLGGQNSGGGIVISFDGNKKAGKGTAVNRE